MTQQQSIVKPDAIQNAGGAASFIGAIRKMGTGSPLLADDPKLYFSHPNPTTNYEEAVQRVESMLSAEVDFNPDCHTRLLTHDAKTARTIVFIHGYPSSPAAFKELGEQFYDLGYNVLIAPLPYHGLADRMNTKHAKLQAEDFVRYTDKVVDIGRGLGDHLTLAGISFGGLATGWAAQQRQDIDLAVLISPGFHFKAIPERLASLASKAFRLLPNWYIWEDPSLKADYTPYHSYPRMATRVLGQILRFSQGIQALAQQKAPAARSILVITNANDPGVDNAVTARVVELWHAAGSTNIRTYEFPEDLQLGHDLTDLQQPDQETAAMISAVVYPKLIELIDQ